MVLPLKTTDAPTGSDVIWVLTLVVVTALELPHDDNMMTLDMVTIANNINRFISFVYFCAQNKAKHLTQSQAFRYLRRFKGISLINLHYNIMHTLRMEDVLDDLTAYCRRQGGAIA